MIGSSALWRIGMAGLTGLAERPLSGSGYRRANLVGIAAGNAVSSRQ